MKKKDRNYLKVVRIIGIITSVVMVIVAFIVDWIGLSAPGNFSDGQILLVSIGAVMLVIALLGQRIATVYRGTAILVLNTIVLLILLDLGAALVLKMADWGVFPGLRQPQIFEDVEQQEALRGTPRGDLSYYTTQDWTAEYFREQSALAWHYQPWVIWGRNPFEGTTINIDQKGLRQVPGANCHTESYKVFVFGGSTLWGAGSPDWGTIPAYLQVKLDEMIDQPVCVINFGEWGYVSKQEVIQLSTQLQFGNVPDLVIFYDGVNDVATTYESGKAGLHYSLEQMNDKLYPKKEPFVERLMTSSFAFSWLRKSYSFILLQRLLSIEPEPDPKPENYRTVEIDADSLADSVVQAYLGNYRIVKSLAQEYDFDCFFFWQPVISVGGKPLTEEERFIKSTMELDMIEFYSAVYQKVEQIAPEHNNLYYIAPVFGKQDSLIWLDFNHVTPEGNQLIAQEMLDTIRLDLNSVSRVETNH